MYSSSSKICGATFRAVLYVNERKKSEERESEVCFLGRQLLLDLNRVAAIFLRHWELEDTRQNMESVVSSSEGAN